jgi:serine phosphatase RsbU (regulator of sigma subunit)
LTENIRGRLGRDEHVTLTLLRYDFDGRVRFAGAHEDLLVCPANGGACKQIRTTGTWSGQRADISRVTTDSELRLEDGDVLVLFTDGIIEARSGTRGEEFGVTRLCAELEAGRQEPVEAIRDRVFGAVARWTKGAAADDDMSLVVLRYRAAKPVPPGV